MWQWEDQAQHQEDNRSRYSHKGHNNNNNNTEEKMFSLWDTRNPIHCDNMRPCRWDMAGLWLKCNLKGQTIHQLPLFPSTDVSSSTPTVLPVPTAPQPHSLCFRDMTITSLSYAETQNLVHLNTLDLHLLCHPAKRWMLTRCRSQQWDPVWCGNMENITRALYQEGTRQT